MCLYSLEFRHWGMWLGIERVGGVRERLLYLQFSLLLMILLLFDGLVNYYMYC